MSKKKNLLGGVGGLLIIWILLFSTSDSDSDSDSCSCSCSCFCSSNKFSTLSEKIFKFWLNSGNSKSNFSQLWFKFLSQFSSQLKISKNLLLLIDGNLGNSNILSE